jgi:hypothetical protein
MDPQVVVAGCRPSLLEVWSAGRSPGEADREAACDLIAWGLSHLDKSRRPTGYERRLVRLLRRGGRLSRREAATVAGLLRVERQWRDHAFLARSG